MLDEELGEEIDNFKAQILIVDDEPFNIYALQSMIKAQGHKT